MVYNGKPTREWLLREDSASLNVSLESIKLIAIIDTCEDRDIMTADITSDPIQCPLNTKKGEKWMIIKLTGVLIDMLVHFKP